MGTDYGMTASQWVASQEQVPTVLDPKDGKLDTDAPDGPEVFRPSASTYRGYINETPETISPSVCVFAVATALRTTPPRVFRTGSDITYRRETWSSTRRREWPEIPGVDETKGALLCRVVNPAAPIVEQHDGVATFRISGSQWFVKYVASTPLTDLPTGRVPYMTNDPAEIDLMIQATDQDIELVAGRVGKSKTTPTKG